MAIAFGTSVTPVRAAQFATTVDFTIDCGSAANTALVVFVWTSSSGLNVISSATFNGVAASGSSTEQTTQAGANSKKRIFWWLGVSGSFTGTVVVDITGGQVTWLSVAPATWTGVSAIGTPSNTNSGSGTTVNSATISSATGNVVGGFLFLNNQTTTLTASSPTVINAGYTSNGERVEIAQEVGAASVVLTATAATSVFPDTIAFGMTAAAAGGLLTPAGSMAGGFLDVGRVGKFFGNPLQRAAHYVKRSGIFVPASYNLKGA